MTKNPCPKCSHPIPESAPGGICPKCLLQAGMAAGSDADTVAPKGAYSVPAADSLISTFPNLEIEYLIGQGGMGAVYKARQTNLDRVVALKILSPQLGDDPSFAERFTREARTLAKLSHPNIVTVFDFGVADSMHYLVMEFIDGVNLRDTILATEYSPTEALAAITQICDALQYAHDAGVVHRDIKPENILVDRNGVVKIADFGLAKLLTPTPEEFTLTGTRQVLGTLKYMAPEQIEKPEQVDHRADLYSLGVVFYELLTGELPIGRFAVPSAKAEINRRLDDVVLKTLEKEPAHRYQQASEIKTAVAAASIAHDVEPQPVDPAVAQHTTTPPRSFVVPFTTDDIYGGMANGFGIARFVHPNTLRVEIEVRDCFGATNLSLKSVDVPIESLSSIRFKSGIFKDKITIQADSIASLGEIPSAKMGSLNLYTKKADSVLAQQLTMDIHDRLPTAHYVSNAMGRPVPQAPVKQDWNASSDEDFHNVGKQLRIPMIGFFVTSMLYLLTAFGGSLGRWIQRNEPDVDLAAPIEFLVKLVGNNHSDMFLQLSVAGALITFAAAYLLWRRNSYGWTMGALILACIPIHPLTVLSFAFGIWGLVVIDQPAAKEVFRGKRERFDFTTFVPVLLFFAAPFVLIFGLWFAYWSTQLSVVKTSSAPVTTQIMKAEVAPSQLESSKEISSAESPVGTSVSTEIQNGAVIPADPPVVKAPEQPQPVASGPVTSNRVLPTYRFSILFVVGTVVLLAFATVLGLVLYLVSRKAR